MDVMCIEVAGWIETYVSKVPRWFTIDATGVSSVSSGVIAFNDNVGMDRGLSETWDM